MTVRELIAELAVMPQDFQVIYCCCSDYSTLDPGDVTIQRSSDMLKIGMAVNHHNRPGQYRRYAGSYEHKGSPPPKPADVVIFPGN